MAGAPGATPADGRTQGQGSRCIFGCGSRLSNAYRLPVRFVNRGTTWWLIVAVVNEGWTLPFDMD